MDELRITVTSLDGRPSFLVSKEIDPRPSFIFELVERLYGVVGAWYQIEGQPAFIRAEKNNDDNDFASDY